MSILSEAPLKKKKTGLRWKFLQWSLRKSSRTQQDKLEVDSAVSYPQLDPPNFSELYITSPSLWWRKRVRLTHHRCKAAYPVTRVYWGSVGIQQKQEKVAVIRGYSHWLCVYLWVLLQGFWASGHLLSPKSANSFEWIPQSFEALCLVFLTGIALLLYFW